jgi:hypothetical protein
MFLKLSPTLRGQDAAGLPFQLAALKAMQELISNRMESHLTGLHSAIQER